MSVTVRRVVVSIHLEHPVDGETRRISRHQDDRLLLVGVVVVGVGVAHDDVDLAPRVTRAAGPPLLTVEKVAVAIPLDVELDVGGVRRGNIGFRHQEARPDLALHQRPEPLLLLRGVAVLGQNLHVARVRSGAVACLRGRARPSQPLRHQTVL
jgi:hypothetical protein